MYFAKKYTKVSLASIGSQIGKRDHATVLHACKTVDNLSLQTNIQKYVEDLNQNFLSNLEVKTSILLLRWENIYFAPAEGILKKYPRSLQGRLRRKY